MLKNSRERRMIFSNVKDNKKKADEKSASKSNELFDYNNEVVIGLKVVPKPKISKVKSKKKETDELEIPFQDKDVDKNKKKKKTKSKKKNKTPKKTKKINKKRRKLILCITKWTTLALVIICALIFLMLSPVFNIKTISITGNEQISSETINSLSGIQINDNLFKIRKSQVIKNIKQNAYIESVEVSKKMCDKIEIKIQERKATFMIKIGDGYVYLNNQGYILEISSEKLTMPLIIGSKTQNSDLLPGNRLEKEDLEKLEMVLKIRDVAQSNEFGDLITGIDISDDNNYKIIFETEGKVAYLGDCSNLSTRLLYVKAMLQQEKGHEGEIFVDIDLNSNYPFFREKV